MKKYEQIFDLRGITPSDETDDNVEMGDLGIISNIESAMMDRIGKKVRVIITICKYQD